MLLRNLKKFFFFYVVSAAFCKNEMYYFITKNKFKISCQCIAVIYSRVSVCADKWTCFQKTSFFFLIKKCALYHSMWNLSVMKRPFQFLENWEIPYTFVIFMTVGPLTSPNAKNYFWLSSRLKFMLFTNKCTCLVFKFLLRGHGDRVVTLLPPTSEAGVRSPWRP